MDGIDRLLLRQIKKALNTLGGRVTDEALMDWLCANVSGLDGVNTPLGRQVLKEEIYRVVQAYVDTSDVDALVPLLWPLMASRPTMTVQEALEILWTSGGRRR